MKKNTSKPIRQNVMMSKETIKKLNDHKQHPRETYEDVIKRAIAGLEDKQ